MKFEARTVDILKSISNINPAMKFQVGNVLRVKSESGTVAAVATIKESFDKVVTIIDIPQFLNVLSLFGDKYDIEFGETTINIKGEDGRKIKYNYTAESLVKDFKKVVIPGEVVVNFNLAQNDINKFIKLSSVLSLDNLVVVGSEGKLLLRGMSSREADGGNYHEIAVGDTNHEFQAVVNVDYISKLYPGDYSIDIYKVNEVLPVSMWKGKDVEYIIAVEADRSKYTA